TILHRVAGAVSVWCNLLEDLLLPQHLQVQAVAVSANAASAWIVGGHQAVVAAIGVAGRGIPHRGLFDTSLAISRPGEGNRTIVGVNLPVDLGDSSLFKQVLQPSTHCRQRLEDTSGE